MQVPQGGKVQRCALGQVNLERSAVGPRSARVALTRNLLSLSPSTYSARAYSISNMFSLTCIVIESPHSVSRARFGSPLSESHLSLKLTSLFLPPRPTASQLASVHQGYIEGTARVRAPIKSHARAARCPSGDIRSRRNSASEIGRRESSVSECLAWMLRMEMT